MRPLFVGEVPFFVVQISVAQHKLGKRAVDAQGALSWKMQNLQQ